MSSNNEEPEAITPTDIPTIEFSVSGKPSAGIRDKAMVRKLENTVTYLRTELANELHFKEEVMSALAKSEAAYQQLSSEMRQTVERLEALRASELAEARAQSDLMMEAQANEVRRGVPM